MKNLRIGTVSHIGIFLHWTFLVMMVGIFGFYLYQGASVGAALAGVALVATVFGCVILHELGHALMAKRFGIRTLDITMYPIGGIARLQELPRRPIHELWIALAGPAVNLAIAAVLYVINSATGRLLSVESLMQAPTNVLGVLMWVNVGLALFNMLPAFPMDGGRVLRAGLAIFMPFDRATYIATFIAQVMAVLFFIAGLVIFNPVLLFIAVFVFGAARQEAQQVARSS